MGADLHSHTTYSDGRAGPYDLARMAWASGLTGLAITDHDTLAHFDETSEACRTFGIEWIPGVELSAEVPQAPGVPGPPASVHVLGLWVRDDDNPLTVELARLRTARVDRAMAMVERVNALGGQVDVDRMLEDADGASLGRPHVARAMVAAGVVPTVGQAFKQYLREDGPAYVPKGAIGPVRAVELIRAAGGAAVLAHPTWGGVDRQMLDAMCTAGLAGVESPRQAYEPDAADMWARTAAARDLILTTSSDFHGEAELASMGDYSTRDVMVSALQHRAGGELSQW